MIGDRDYIQVNDKDCNVYLMKFGVSKKVKRIFLESLNVKRVLSSYDSVTLIVKFYVYLIFNLLKSSLTTPL